MSAAVNVMFLAGDRIAVAAVDLCDAARRLGLVCFGHFNGVTLWATPDTDPVGLVEAYFSAKACGAPAARTERQLSTRLRTEGEAMTAQLIELTVKPAEGSA